MSEETNEDLAGFTCRPPLPLFSDLSLVQENAWLIAAAFFVAFSTWALLKFYDALSNQQLWKRWVKLWPFLGFFPYLVVGATHFGEAGQKLACIVPPNGTWGWWWTPLTVPAVVIWTGYAEIGLGFLLVVSGIIGNSQLLQYTAWCLFFMTIGMTFANIYMLTHGTSPMDNEEPFSLSLHIIRCFVQAIWLSNLYYMAVAGGKDVEKKKK
jgi:uncharacterized membrane protein